MKTQLSKALNLSGNMYCELSQLSDSDLGVSRGYLVWHESMKNEEERFPDFESANHAYHNYMMRGYNP